MKALKWLADHMGIHTELQKAKLDKLRAETARMGKGGMFGENVGDDPITAALKETFGFSHSLEASRDCSRQIVQDSGFLAILNWQPLQAVSGACASFGGILQAGSTCGLTKLPGRA